MESVPVRDAPENVDNRHVIYISFQQAGIGLVCIFE
jgi:hypothetical protein